MFHHLAASPGVYRGRGLRDRERKHARAPKAQAQNWYDVTPTEFYQPKQVHG